MSLKQHVIVVGLGFGDEGKGSTIDALSSKEDFDLVVRFNGGQQAGHNVINKGRHHTFTQFGSGFFNGVPSHTSRFCTFDPLTFNREAASLSQFTDQDPYTLHTVSPDALLTTPLHIMANHEMEEKNGHGTVGVGFGETIRYSLQKDNALTVSDLKNPKRLEYKLWDLYHHYLMNDLLVPGYDLSYMVGDLVEFGAPVKLADDSEVMDLENKRVLFEGAQGALLDQDYGFHPHTTWSSTTPANAKELLEDHENTVIGVTRTYHTRHGAGPLQGEGLFAGAPKELHNRDDGNQGVWRTAGFSVALFKYALEVVNPDFLSVTHADVEAPVFTAPHSLSAPWEGFSPEDRLLELEGLGRQTLESSLIYRPNQTALGAIRSFGTVLLWSDGPNDTDRKWER